MPDIAIDVSQSDGMLSAIEGKLLLKKLSTLTIVLIPKFSRIIILTVKVSWKNILEEIIVSISVLHN